MNKTTWIVTLNWNTTELLKRMVLSVEEHTWMDHRWIILDNGSDEPNKAALWRFLKDQYVFRGVDFLIHRLPFNVGCILAHNRVFDVAARYGVPHQIVMIDTDVEITEPGWLTKANAWADEHPEVGIVGMEHTAAEVCAPAVFIDTNGNWYLHQSQTQTVEPAEGETVGLGLALIRWPVLQAGMRFDEGFKLYYKQDDDLCFKVRADMGLEVWAYPVGCIHYGSGSLKENEYNVAGVQGWDEFDQVKQDNQKYFVTKWRWALTDRRRNMEEQAEHLVAMKQTMLKGRS